MKHLHLIAKALGITIIKTTYQGYPGYTITGVGCAQVHVDSVADVAQKLAEVIERQRQHLERLKQQDKVTAVVLEEAVEINNRLLGKGATS